jgi:hypothetical protein
MGAHTTDATEQIDRTNKPVFQERVASATLEDRDKNCRFLLSAYGICEGLPLNRRELFVRGCFSLTTDSFLS